MSEWIIRERRVELELETDIDDELLKSLKWWEDLTHTDECPYFLITKVVHIRDLGEIDTGNDDDSSLQTSAPDSGGKEDVAEGLGPR